MPGKKNDSQKPTIGPNNHDQNVGQRGGVHADADAEVDHGGTGKPHSAEPNTGMPLTGNKVHGDDLESIIPGKDRTKRDDGR